MTFGNYFIRPLASEDLHEYFAMVERNRSRLADFFTGTVSKTRTLEDTRMFLAEIEEKRNNRIYFPYLVIERDSNKIIGFLDLKNIDWTIPKAEMGCYMDADHAGKGVASKAFAVFCDHCFTAFSFEKLFLRTHESNIAAQKLAERNGFEREGVIRKDYKTTSGELVDLIYYGRLRKP
jgi:RimJ/RimL family protein N-acetyltransferase